MITGTCSKCTESEWGELIALLDKCCDTCKISIKRGVVKIEAFRFPVRSSTEQKGDQNENE